jgi:3D (Asp-Asp-Asp) domain-containing protein
MEAKCFFSKSSNILSVAILLAGLSTFGAGVKISETNAKDMQKQKVENEHRIELMENSLSKQLQEVDAYKLQLEKQKDKIHSLEKNNDILKKKVEFYKNRSESPSLRSKKAVTQPSRGTQANPKIYMNVTGYTAGYESTQKSKNDPAYGLTASGTYVTEGRTIACPRSMKFGTKVHIQGLGYRVCEDRGGAITNGHIDVFFNSLSTAQNFGRKTLQVEILN